MTSDYLNHLLKGPVSKYHCILRSGDLGLEHMNFGGGGWGNTVQLITQSKSQVRSPEDAFAGVALTAKIPNPLPAAWISWATLLSLFFLNYCWDSVTSPPPAPRESQPLFGCITISIRVISTPQGSESPSKDFEYLCSHLL